MQLNYQNTTNNTTTTTQTTVKRARLACLYCPKTFKTKSKVNRHTREIHLNPQKQFACSLCPKAFKRREHIKRHMRGKHQAKKFVCHLCPSEHVEKSRLKAHLTRVHCFKACSKCGLFSTKTASKSHQCPKAMLCLPKHILKYGVVFDCKDCLTCFVTENALEIHACSKKTSLQVFENFEKNKEESLLKKREICVSEAETQPDTPEAQTSFSGLPKKKLKRLELNKVWNPFQEKEGLIFGNDPMLTPSPFRSKDTKTFEDFFGSQEDTLGDDLASAIGLPLEENQEEGFVSGLLNDVIASPEEAGAFRFDLEDAFPQDKNDFMMNFKTQEPTCVLDDLYF